MKIKKILSVLLVAAVILIPSASAFAEETETAATEISPRVIGIGDTQDSAISLVLNGAGGVLGGVVYDLFIQSALIKIGLSGQTLPALLRELA